MEAANKGRCSVQYRYDSPVSIPRARMAYLLRAARSRSARNVHRTVVGVYFVRDANAVLERGAA
jgi:hypothetical protein